MDVDWLRVVDVDTTAFGADAAAVTGTANQNEKETKIIIVSTTVQFLTVQTSKQTITVRTCRVVVGNKCRYGRFQFDRSKVFGGISWAVLPLTFQQKAKSSMNVAMLRGIRLETNL